MWMDRFRYYTEWNDFVNRKRYDAPADSWKLIHVNPANVDSWTVIEIKWGLGRIQGGEWDDTSNLRAVSDLPVYKGFKQRFEEGAEWEETVYFEQADSRIDEDGQFRGCEDTEEFLETECPMMDELYESIRQEGYRPNRGTVYESHNDADSPHDLEPMVLIGRSGEVYWTEGFHRFVIARLRNIKEVPVYVLQRHEEWQKVRDEIHRTPISELSIELEAYTDHPDIEDVLS